MNRNRILNRPLRPEWLDASLRLARTAPDGATGRRLLEVALRDALPADEARLKTVEAIHPVWLNPPPEIAPMIDWAIEHSRDAADLRPVHLVALIATYPFFGEVCSSAGRLIRLGGATTNAELRSRLRARWGDREIINVAIRKCVLTLRSFGVLKGERGLGRSTLGPQLALPPSLVPWAVHALIETRGAEAIDDTEAESAPEFFFLDLRLANVNGYPYLERFAVSPSRSSYVATA